MLQFEITTIKKYKNIAFKFILLHYNSKPFLHNKVLWQCDLMIYLKKILNYILVKNPSLNQLLNKRAIIVGNSMFLG